MHLSIIKYRPEIDGLRAIAVISVIFYHFLPELFKFGYLGKSSGGGGGFEERSTSCFRVIQNDAVKGLEKLNIKFFFNANSFQEMDAAQIEAYCEFMNRNKSASSYLAAFFYDSNKESNSPKMPLDILRNNFSIIGSMHIKELFDNSNDNIPQGIAKGSMYLLRLDR